jgi:hypothetical protein
MRKREAAGDAGMATVAPTRRALVDNARTFVGSRFVHQGRMRTVLRGRRAFGGIDCAGMTIVPAQEIGLRPGVGVHIYRREPNGSLMQAELARWLTPKALTAGLPGDVVYLKHPMAKYAHHLGLLSDLYFDGRPLLGIIHACLRHRRVVECCFDEELRAWTTACYSYPELVGETTWPERS